MHARLTGSVAYSISVLPTSASYSVTPQGNLLASSLLLCQWSQQWCACPREIEYRGFIYIIKKSSQYITFIWMDVDDCILFFFPTCHVGNSVENTAVEERYLVEVYHL